MVCETIIRLLISNSIMKKIKSFFKRVLLFFLSKRSTSGLCARLFRNRLMDMTQWGGGTFRDDIERFLPVFLDKETLDVSHLRTLESDIISSYFLYGTTVQEYLCFGFRDYNHKRRSSFLSNQHKDQTELEILGFNSYEWSLLEDKALLYQKCSKYFKRDVCYLNENGKKDFFSFCMKHSRFIAKPNDGQCGAGIKICEVDSNSQNSIQNAYDELSAEGGFLIEELIFQHQSMAAFNPDSINTVRIPSFYVKSGVQLLKPFVRFGRKGTIVDNANAGGLFAVIGSDGVIETDGFCLSDNKYYNEHPDSHVVIKGWQIPQWQQLLSLVKEIHSSLSVIPYIGFDFAYTNQGWVLVEANCGQFVSEFCDKEGIKLKFDKLMLNARNS